MGRGICIHNLGSEIYIQFSEGRCIFLFTICDLRSAFISEEIRGRGRVSVIHNLQFSMCVYFSEDRGVEVWVSDI